MFRPWKLALFFVLCLAASLLANMPAALVLARLPLDPALRLSAIDGSVVQGRIGRIEYDGLALDRVDYRLRPRCLLGLELCYRLDSDLGRLHFGWASLSGDATVSDARLELPAAMLAAFAPTLPLRVTGRIELELNELRLVGGRPAALAGQLQWRGLGADDGDNPLVLGDYRATISGDGELFRAEFSTLDANLKLDGDASLGADGRYEIDLSIGSEQAIDSRAKTLLDLFARSSGYNQYRVQRQGSLPPGQLRQLFPPPG